MTHQGYPGKRWAKKGKPRKPCVVCKRKTGHDEDCPRAPWRDRVREPRR